MASEKKNIILVVDDEPDIRTYLSTMLEDNGYTAITAENGNSGLEMVKEQKPDLILLDISMPEKSGVKMYRELMEADETRNVPVIIVTGISKDFKQFIATRKQVPPPTDYVSKPIEREEFLEKVSMALTKGQA